MGTGASSGGLLPALRGLLVTLLEIAQVRLALLGTELELEKRRLFDGLLLVALALALLTGGLLALCALLVLLLWDSYRVVALAGMALVLLGSGCVVLLCARRAVHRHEGLLVASLTELERDRAGLDRRDEHA